MRSVRAGQLRKRLVLQSKTRVRDEGERVTGDGWADVASIWASITPANGRELVVGDQVLTTHTHVIRTRRRNIKPDQRVKYAPWRSWWKLAADITDSDTTATIVNADSDDPGSGTLLIDSEQVTFTRSGTTLTIARGANSTTPAAHTAGTQFQYQDIRYYQLTAVGDTDEQGRLFVIAAIETVGEDG